MKKTVISIIVILLIIVITSGVTYAYFSATTVKNNINSEATQIEVIYTNGNNISGEMNLTRAKEGGYNTTVYIKQTNNGVPVEANLFVDIKNISSDLASKGFIWEVYKIYGGATEKVAEGNFLGCENGQTTKKCANGDRMYLVRNYALKNDNTGFTIYFWLNGDLVGNEIIGTTFNGEIGAHTNKITGATS